MTKPFPFRRVAVVFDQQVRPDTTGTYCLMALRELVPAEHLSLKDAHNLRGNPFDLYVRIDDGLPGPWPDDLGPSVFWAIDTHMNYERSRNAASAFDLVFAAQRDGAESLRSDGIASAIWLPLAADPEIHRRHDLPLCWDVSFVGHIHSQKRRELLKLIQQEFPNSYVGQRFFDEMAQVYSQSRIVFNRSVKNDINMRVFEAMASGAFLITNDLTENGQGELFRDGEHLVTYRDERELVEKIRHFLDDDPARENIARAGQKEVLKHHTYRHRMQTLLETVTRELGERPAKTDPNQQTILVNGSSRLPETAAVKDPSYFEHSRPEVVALIPHSARSVLDIGCGAGCLGEALKQRQDVSVVGIEMEEAAAKAARTRLDTVIRGDLESGEVNFSRGQFDCVVCADVLEHLRSPEAALEKIHRWLAPGGSLVVSLPNARHHSVIRSLLAGNWTYESAGLLDQDHLRFFTRREMEKLFFRAGFSIEKRCEMPGPSDPAPGEFQQMSRLTHDLLGYKASSPKEASEFFVYQYLFSAQPLAHPRFETTSIVVVTHNELAYTKLCVDSIRHLTDEPYELIVVDNGSSDGTVSWLKRQADVRLIENADNRGFPAAANQGMKAATGEQILLLNNDTVVTTGWLKRLLEALKQDPQIGLAGPCTNNVSGPQQVATAYRNLSELDGFAWDWGKDHHGELQDVDRLVGFCLLIRRELLDRVGFLDERFGKGCFEDDDYCRRARDAGYRAVIARDSLIHHFGSRTFRSSGQDLGAILQENRQKYEEKWNGSEVDRRKSAVSSSSVRLGRHPQGGLVIQPAAPRLSLCMIVRDNEHTIRPCLESIRPFVDEMVVVDTGSTDSTPEICRELGARVEHFPWCDDFSAARNESVKYAAGEWIFWMDSDDTIPRDCGQRLRALADKRHDEGILGYVMQVHCPGRESGITVVDQVKMFQNRPDLRFEFRIHEQILPAIRRAGGDVDWADVFVVHSGSDASPTGQRKKHTRDLRILKKELEERPDHPFVLFNLGMTCSEAELPDDAELYLRRCLDVTAPGESHLRKAYAILVAVLMQKKDDDSAFKVCNAGVDRFPRDPELLFRRGMLHHAAGRCYQAIEDYRRILDHKAEKHFASRDVGILGYKTRHNLALVYEDVGDVQEALDQWKQILREQPDYVPARTALRQIESQARI